MDRSGIVAAGDRHDARSHGGAARRPGLTESARATQFPLVSAEVVVLQASGRLQHAQQAEGEPKMMQIFSRMGLSQACK